MNKYKEELKVEFARWYQHKDDNGTDYVADWWLSKFTSYTTTLLSEVEKMRKPNTFEGNPPSESAFFVTYNQALEDIINLIKNNV